MWRGTNKMLVGFGQTVCTPINPKCPNCPVVSLCPSSRTFLAKYKKKAELEAKKVAKKPRKRDANTQVRPDNRTKRTRKCA